MNNLTIDVKEVSTVVNKVSKVESILQDSTRSALSAASFIFINASKKIIDADGAGNWPTIHPLTETFHRGFKDGSRWNSRGRKKAPFRFLKSFISSTMSGDRIKIGVSQRSGAPKELNKVVKRVFFGGNIPVTDKSRRLLGSTRRKKANIPGVDFFPLRADTKSLNVPKRTVFEPAFKENVYKVNKVFTEKYSKVFDKKYKKLKSK